MARTVKLAVYEPDKGEVNDLLKQKGIYKKTICGITTGRAVHLQIFSLAAMSGTNTRGSMFRVINRVSPVKRTTYTAKVRGSCKLTNIE